MIENTRLVSEDTVKDFITVVKAIAGINLTTRDEHMMELILTAKNVNGDGIEVAFYPHKVAVASRDFSAQFSRRKRYGRY